MANYDKDKDLARILIEGTRAVYGPERSERLRSEFKRSQQQIPYRKNAEELTAILERVCDTKEIPQTETVEAKFVESIDGVVDDYEPKPNMIKVAAKGTWNLVKKTHIQDWYYPMVGFLPGRYQQKIADKYGDNPFHYTISNAATEGILATGLLSSLTNVTAGILLGSVYIIIALIRGGIANDSHTEKAAGSLLTCVPFYVTLCSIAAFKAMKNGIINAYSSALQEEKEKSKPKRIATTIAQTPVRVEEVAQIEVNLDEFENQPDEEESEEARRKRLIEMDI